MKQHNVSTIEVLESRLSDHNNNAQIIAAEIQANLNDLESYLFQVGNNKTDRRPNRATGSASSDKDGISGTNS